MDGWMNGLMRDARNHCSICSGRREMDVPETDLFPALAAKPCIPWTLLLDLFLVDGLNLFSGEDSVFVFSLGKTMTATSTFFCSMVKAVVIFLCALTWKRARLASLGRSIEPHHMLDHCSCPVSVVELDESNRFFQTHEVHSCLCSVTQQWACNAPEDLERARCINHDRKPQALPVGGIGHPHQSPNEGRVYVSSSRVTVAIHDHVPSSGPSSSFA
mmetsp:Transcript_59525/g.126105  ORF Transcript_59525/g.126105 Transcript_59525/m.126105 type:complete len:216 (-) Transcript_59525:587-1234(-)